MDDGGLGQIGVEDLVPSHHGLAVGRDDLRHLTVEVGLEVDVGLHPVGLLEGHDLRIAVPRVSFHLVATDVEHVVGEEAGHFAEERVEEAVGLLPCGIHDGLEDSPGADDGVGAGLAGELGVADEPARGVARHVELGHDTYASIRGQRDDAADLVLGVEEPVGAHLVEPGVAPALHTKALILREVPVEDVHLHGGHGIESPLENGHGHEVASGIHEEAAPGESGPIADGHCGELEAFRSEAHELEECFEAAQCPPGLRSLDRRARGGDAECVALIHGGGRHSGLGTEHGERERPGRGGRRVGEWNTRRARETREEAGKRSVDAKVPWPLGGDTKRSVEGEGALLESHLRRKWHQGEG